MCRRETGKESDMDLHVIAQKIAGEINRAFPACKARATSEGGRAAVKIPTMGTIFVDADTLDLRSSKVSSAKGAGALALATYRAAKDGAS